MKPVEHLVSFRFKPEVTQQQKLRLIEMLYGLYGKIDGLVAMSAGLNTTEETEFMHGYGAGMRMLFRDRDALRRYQVQPDHLRVVDYIRKITDDVAVMDFEIETQSDGDTP